jgi:hypothetical protein
MPSDYDAEVDFIARLVLRYLAQHSDAADTLEGIQTWWLRSQGHDAPKAFVEDALDRLVGQGELVRTGQPPRSIYGRNRDRPKS